MSRRWFRKEAQMKNKAKLLIGTGAAAAAGIVAVSLRLAGLGHSGEELVYKESKAE